MSDAPDREPGQLLGAIFSSSPDAIIVVDSQGTIVLSSPSVTSLFGYYPEELVGASITTLLPLDRRVVHQRHLQHFFESPHARQMGAGLELFGRHRDGSEFSVDVSLAPVTVLGRRYAAAFVRDATERQRAIDRLDAVNEITRDLLSGSSAERIFSLVARRARELSRSDAVWIVLPRQTGDLEIAYVAGPQTEVLLGQTLSATTSRSALVMGSGRSELVADLSAAENVPRRLPSLDLGPGLYVPLVEADHRLGAIVFARRHEAPSFDRVEVAFAEVFASSIATAIELGEARSEVERLGIVAEDERIARDLHDTVIQQLFAIGMSLQSARNGVVGVYGERIDQAVGDLDEVIKEIRNTIFRLPGRSETTLNLRDEMLRVADKYRAELGLSPRIAFEGPVDTALSDRVVSHLLQVFGEGLSNVARHSQASKVEAVASIDDGWLKFTLTDDGVGIGPSPSAGSGLRNLAARAEELGGVCSVRATTPRGTCLEWRVPI